MNVGIITTTNQKGQIVIPKKFREALGIGPEAALNLVLRGKVLCLYPIEEVVTKTERESAYLNLLKKTQGTWAKEDWPLLRKKREKAELTASAKRKQAW